MRRGGFARKGRLVAVGLASVLLGGLVWAATPAFADQPSMTMTVDPNAQLDKSGFFLTLTGTYNCTLGSDQSNPQAGLNVIVTEATRKGTVGAQPFSNVDASTCNSNDHNWSLTVEGQAWESSCQEFNGQGGFCGAPMQWQARKYAGVQFQGNACDIGGNQNTQPYDCSGFGQFQNTTVFVRPPSHH